MATKIVDSIFIYTYLVSMKKVEYFNVFINYYYHSSNYIAYAAWVNQIMFNHIINVWLLKSLFNETQSKAILSIGNHLVVSQQSYLV